MNIRGVALVFATVLVLSACGSDPAPKVTVTASASEAPAPVSSPSPSPSPSPSEAAPLPPGNLFDGRVGFTITATKTADESTDASGNPVSYDAANIADADPGTAWRKPTDGWGDADYLLITFDEPVRLTEVGLIPGYAKKDPATGTDRFTQNYRLAQVRWKFSDGSEWTQSFEDKPTMQTIPVSGEVTWVRIAYMSVGYPRWPDEPARKYIAISDVTITGEVIGK